MHLPLSAHCTACVLVASSCSVCVGVFVHRLSGLTGFYCLLLYSIDLFPLWSLLETTICRRKMTKTCFAITHIAPAENGHFCLLCVWSPNRSAALRDQRSKGLSGAPLSLILRCNKSVRKQCLFKTRLNKVVANRTPIANTLYEKTRKSSPPSLMQVGFFNNQGLLLEPQSISPGWFYHHVCYVHAVTGPSQNT